MKNRNHNFTNFNKNLMYLSIFGILSLHIFFSIIWWTNDKIKLIISYTNDPKEYTKCSYPKSKNIRYIIENEKENSII